jgi:hypothetical protein
MGSMGFGLLDTDAVVRDFTRASYPGSLQINLIYLFVCVKFKFILSGTLLLHNRTCLISYLCR